MEEQEIVMATYEPLLTSGKSDEKSQHGHITLLRAVAVLTNIITGVGLLGIPYCFRSGLGTNLVVISSIALLSCFSFSILIDCAVLTNCHHYPKLIQLAFPNRKVQWIPDATIVLLLLGGTILYLQFSSKMMISFLNEFNVPKFLTNPWFIVFVVQFVIDCPLVLLKSMNHLSFVSFLSVLLIACYVVHSIFFFARTIKNDGFDKDHQFKVFDFNLGQILPSMAIQASSYTCHPSIFPTLVKLENPTKLRLNVVMILVTICASILYLVGGIFPYLTLFDGIEDAVVLNYYGTHLFTTIIKACYSIILVLTAPMLIFACRLSLHDLFFKYEMTTLQHYLWGIGILVFSGLIAVNVSSVNLVFGVVGGVSAPLLIYILPSIYYIRICKDGSAIKKGISYFSLVLGPLFMAVCLYDSIKTIIQAIKN